MTRSAESIRESTSRVAEPFNDFLKSDPPFSAAKPRRFNKPPGAKMPI
jgi:hypothetical protein